MAQAMGMPPLPETRTIYMSAEPAVASETSRADDSTCPANTAAPSFYTLPPSDVTTAATVTPRPGGAPTMQAASAHQHWTSERIRELEKQYKHEGRSSFNTDRNISLSEDEANPFSLVPGDGEVIGLKPLASNEDDLQNGGDA